MGAAASIPKFDDLPAELSQDEAQELAGEALLDADAFKEAWKEGATDGKIGRMDFVRHAERLKSVYWTHRAKYHTKVNGNNKATVTLAVTNAARAICAADVLLITTGAGMGVDMGLADFRSSNFIPGNLSHLRYEVRFIPPLL